MEMELVPIWTVYLVCCNKAIDRTTFDSNLGDISVIFTWRKLIQGTVDNSCRSLWFIYCLFAKVSLISRCSAGYSFLHARNFTLIWSCTLRNSFKWFQSTSLKRPCAIWKHLHAKVTARLHLTLYVCIDSSFWFYSINLGWSIIYIEVYN